jgi:hypothetical protein
MPIPSSAKVSARVKALLQPADEGSIMALSSSLSEDVRQGS